MCENQFKYAKNLYLSDEKEKAYNYIKDNSVEVFFDEELSFLHINHCLEIGFYNEAYELFEIVHKKYPDSKSIKSLSKVFDSKENFFKRRKKKLKKDDDWDYVCEPCLDCSSCCDIFDVCIDTGAGDSGCIDLDLCCFMD